MIVRLKQGVFNIPEELRDAFYAGALEYIKGEFIVDEDKLLKYQEKQKELESQLKNL